MAKFLLKDTFVMGLIKKTLKETPEGYLLFEHDDEWKKLFFKNAKVISASSSDRADYLGQYLISYGVINIDQFENAYESKLETKESMDAVLRFASPEILGQLVAEKIIDTIFIASQWPDCVYSVVVEEQAKHLNVDVELSIDDISDGLKKRIVEFNDILSSIPQLGARPKIDYNDARNYEITNQKEVVLNYLVAGKTITEILSILAPHNYLLFKCFYKLSQMGVIVKGTGAPLSKEDVINLVNDSVKSKKDSQQVSDFSLNAEMKEKVIREMGEDKYRKAISTYQKLHSYNPENSLYYHLYVKAVSCFIVHFYNNKLSPFAVIEMAHDVEKIDDHVEIDIEIISELLKIKEERSSVKNIVKSLENRHEIDVLVSIDKLIRSGVVVEVEPETFLDAIKLWKNEHFEKLFKKKEKNKLFDSDVSTNLTPLMFSAVTGNYPPEIAKEFGMEAYEKGAEPVLHDYKMTYLMFASMIGNYEAVEFLLLNNVKTDLHNGNGVTALMLALENRHDDVAILLINNRADVNAKNKNDYSALMIAAAKGMSHVVDHMIKFKVNVNHVNLKGQTALISALRFNNEDIVVSLIAAGTDLNSRDADGHTPLYYAESVVITELIRRGARYSKQIKKKQIKKRKKKLAYEKNILTDEKDVVPTSYHVYVFSFMTLVAVLILIYYYVIN